MQIMAKHSLVAKKDEIDAKYCCGSRFAIGMKARLGSKVRITAWNFK